MGCLRPIMSMGQRVGLGSKGVKSFRVVRLNADDSDDFGRAMLSCLEFKKS